MTKDKLDGRGRTLAEKARLAFLRVQSNFRECAVSAKHVYRKSRYEGTFLYVGPAHPTLIDLIQDETPVEQFTRANARNVRKFSHVEVLDNTEDGAAVLLTEANLVSALGQAHLDHLRAFGAEGPPDAP